MKWIVVFAVLSFLTHESLGTHRNDEYGVLYYEHLGMDEYGAYLHYVQSSFDGVKDICRIKVVSTSLITTVYNEVCNIAPNCVSSKTNNCSDVIEKLGVDQHATCYKLADFRGVSCHLECLVGRDSGINVTLSVEPTKSNQTFNVSAFWAFVRTMPIERRNFSEFNLLPHLGDTLYECGYILNETALGTLSFFWFDRFPKDQFSLFNLALGDKIALATGGLIITLFICGVIDVLCRPMND